MKKFLLMLILIGFTSLSANATYEVSYGMGGQRTSVSHGFQTTHSVNGFGRNALFLPENTARAGSRARQIEMQRAMTQALASNMNSQNEVSRYDRSYTVRTQRSYTKNGITYYN